MQTTQLGQYGRDYAKYLNTIKNTVECNHIVAPDAFVRIYQDELPAGSGVYWFSLSNGDVFYIGKADKFTRIWDWTYAADFIEEGIRGFPKCLFCHDERLSDDARENIRRGQFRIDYLVVQPSELASVFEVHLQGAYFLRYGQLPTCNGQFG